MANWVDWNTEKPAHPFYFKDENGNLNPNIAYIEDNKVMLAVRGDDIEYTGVISVWTYDGE